jgi:hypothetical protein
MSSDRATDPSKSATGWLAPTQSRGLPAFWKTPSTRAALACVKQQQRRSRACAMSDRAASEWVMALVRQTWPDSRERGAIAATLAPQVPSWWLGPEEADLLIANALLARSAPPQRDPVRRRNGMAPAPVSLWVIRHGGATGSHATIAN